MPRFYELSAQERTRLFEQMSSKELKVAACAHPGSTYSTGAEFELKSRYERRDRIARWAAVVFGVLAAFSPWLLHLVHWQQ
jgi:hypothetical protein